MAGDIKVQCGTPDNKQSILYREAAGYRAYPQGKPNANVVFVLPSNDSLTEAVKDLVRHFAKAGYYAMAIDYRSRYSIVASPPNTTVGRAFIINNVDSWTQFDTDSALAFAAAEGANAANLAVMGMSWGGRAAWKYTAYNSKVKAACAFYGPLSAPGFSNESTGSNPPVTETHPSPIELAALMKGRVLGFYAGKDPRIPMAGEIEPMRAGLKAAGDAKSRIIIYPEAAHSFFEPGRAYRDPDAKDAWSKMLAWFKAHGV